MSRFYAAPIIRDLKSRIISFLFPAVFIGKTKQTRSLRRSVLMKDLGNEGDESLKDRENEELFHREFEEVAVQHDFKIVRILDVEPHVIRPERQVNTENCLITAVRAAGHGDKIKILLLLISRDRVHQAVVPDSLGVPV
jgi:hypothetical protein